MLMISSSSTLNQRLMFIFSNTHRGKATTQLNFGTFRVSHSNQICRQVMDVVRERWDEKGVRNRSE